jgi:rare lipoprotein A
MVPLLAQAQNERDSIESMAETMSEGTTMLGTYYADRFVGRKTSCGEIFRQNQYTAAHKTIPMGTYLLVTYPVTNQHVVVKVNDRCPKPGILDMTKLAVHTIGIRGSGRVIVRTLDPNMGYFLWSSQDTLAMSEAEYMAYRDRSKPRRISPWPINASLTSSTRVASSNTKPDNPTLKKQTVADKGKKQTVKDKDTLAAPPHPVVVDEHIPKGKRFDIELCTVGSQQAANNEAKRLPQDLQDKVVFDRNFQNRQVRLILVLEENRSHAVRTQAMLIDDFPESYIIVHEE